MKLQQFLDRKICNNISTKDNQILLDLPLVQENIEGNVGLQIIWGVDENELDVALIVITELLFDVHGFVVDDDVGFCVRGGILGIFAC